MFMLMFACHLPVLIFCLLDDRVGPRIQASDRASDDHMINGHDPLQPRSLRQAQGEIDNSSQRQLLREGKGHSFIHSYIHSFFQSVIQSFIHSFIHSFVI